MSAASLALIAGVLVAPSSQAAGEQASLEAAHNAIVSHRSADAIPILEAYLHQHPNTPDALRLLAGAYAAMGRYRDAVVTINRAAELAPHDLDVRLARARILTWAGKLHAARKEEAAIAAVAPNNVELVEARRSTEAKARASHAAGAFITQGISRVTLQSGGTSTWLDTILSGYVKTAPDSSISAEIERDSRTFATDTRLSGRWDMGVSRTTSVHIGAAGTINQHFRERWSLNGGIETQVTPRLALLLDVRHADYGNSATTAVNPSFRLRPGSLPLHITGTWINLIESSGNHRNGVAGRMDVDLPHDRSLFAGAASYPDTEAGITRQARSAFAGCAVPFSDRLTLRVSGSYEHRQQSYTQRTLTASLGWRFGG